MFSFLVLKAKLTPRAPWSHLRALRHQSQRSSNVFIRLRWPAHSTELGQCGLQGPAMFSNHFKKQRPRVPILRLDVRSLHGY